MSIRGCSGNVLCDTRLKHTGLEAASGHPEMHRASMSIYGACESVCNYTLNPKLDGVKARM